MDYDSHHQTVRFLPPAKVLESYRKDYEIMREQMICGETDSFDVILRKLYLLQGKSRVKQLTNISLDTLIVMAGEALTTRAPFEPGALYTFETTVPVIEGKEEKTIRVKFDLRRAADIPHFEQIETTNEPAS